MTQVLAALAAMGEAVVVGRVVANLGYRIFPTSELVCPGCAAGVAASLPGADDDTFIYSAWSFVGYTIQYDLYASDITFLDSSVKCRDCEFPATTLETGNSNCVGSSALLASILRNRLPPERVMMVVGNYTRNGVGGHAWVEVLRDDWYILEATASPQGWRLASASPEYVPLIFFNDVGRTSIRSAVKLGIGRCGSLAL